MLFRLEHTGIHAMNLVIPQVYPEYVNTGAGTIGVPCKPVLFYAMDNAADGGAMALISNGVR